MTGVQTCALPILTVEEELRNQAFAHLSILRNKNISLLENITEKQALIIPEKFSNNLYWQAGHILTTQMSLLYRRSNLEMPLINKKYISFFAKGTSPSDFDSEIPTFKNVLHELKESLSALQNDLHNYSKAKYDVPVLVSFGMTLHSFHDAVLAIPYHEAYHLNAINLILKQIK